MSKIEMLSGVMITARGEILGVELDNDDKSLRSYFEGNDFAKYTFENVIVAYGIQDYKNNRNMGMQNVLAETALLTPNTFHIDLGTHLYGDILILIPKTADLRIDGVMVTHKEYIKRYVGFVQNLAKKFR